MAKVIFTPWKTPSDLLAVRNQFYPLPDYQGPDLRRNACETVAAWKLRGNLPHTVEATALLTDAILHDDASKNSVFAIRATYAAAFCRFVTGLVDSKLGARRSMFSRALELGLPASFVELRHEATHRELPSLVVLRGAVGRSLEWLWGFYWGGISSLGVAGTSRGDGEGVDAAVRGVLAEVGQLLGDGEANGPPRKKRRVQKELGSIAGRVVGVLKAEEGASSMFVRVVLKEMLIPADRKIGESMTEPLSKWDPLLQNITEGHPSFLGTLTETMADELALSRSTSSNTDIKNDPYCEGVYTWLDHVLHSVQWELHRRVLSVSYILAVCEGSSSSNWWIGLLKKRIDKERKGKSGDAFSTITLPPGLSDGSVPEQDFDEGDIKALNKFGWDMADTWDSRPVGVV
ncbi:Las1-like-domain-containing protein [Aspergillus unguis]